MNSEFDIQHKYVMSKEIVPSIYFNITKGTEPLICSQNTDDLQVAFKNTKG